MTTPNAAPIRIFLVEDHPMMREGMTVRLSGEADFEVCGDAEDVPTAVAKIDELRPDLAIVDICLKSGHGIDLIKRLREKHPKLKVLVHSMYEESVYAERALHAGASGYLNKQQACVTLIQAVRTVMDGRIYLSPEMTERILRSRVGVSSNATVSPIENLSNRELEVLTLIGQGKTTGSIAKELHLSVHTIDTYREKLKFKLNLSNSAELNRYAAQWVLENG
jgi:DNA-binding NarL/FixJ family response regulator